MRVYYYEQPEVETMTYGGVAVTDPTLDETGRFTVGPTYYNDSQWYADFVAKELEA